MEAVALDDRSRAGRLFLAWHPVCLPSETMATQASSLTDRQVEEMGVRTAYSILDQSHVDEESFLERTVYPDPAYETVFNVGPTIAVRNPGSIGKTFFGGDILQSNSTKEWFGRWISIVGSPPDRICV